MAEKRRQAAALQSAKPACAIPAGGWGKYSELLAKAEIPGDGAVDVLIEHSGEYGQVKTVRVC